MQPIMKELLTLSVHLDLFLLSDALGGYNFTET